VAEEVAKQYTKIKPSSLLKIWVAGILSRQSSLKTGDFDTKFGRQRMKNTSVRKSQFDQLIRLSGPGGSRWVPDHNATAACGGAGIEGKY